MSRTRSTPAEPPPSSRRPEPGPSPNALRVQAMRRAVVSHLIGQGKTHEEAESLIAELLAPPGEEAMKKHYGEHVAWDDVEAWYTRAVREKLAAAGYVSILPKEDA